MRATLARSDSSCTSLSCSAREHRIPDPAQHQHDPEHALGAAERHQQARLVGLDRHPQLALAAAPPRWSRTRAASPRSSTCAASADAGSAVPHPAAPPEACPPPPRGSCRPSCRTTTVCGSITASRSTSQRVDVPVCEAAAQQLARVEEEVLLPPQPARLGREIVDGRPGRRPSARARTPRARPTRRPRAGSRSVPRLVAARHAAAPGSPARGVARLPDQLAGRVEQHRAARGVRQHVEERLHVARRGGTASLAAPAGREQHA